MPSSALVDSYQKVMADAFKLVEPRDNWKNPIDTRVAIANDAEMALIREAVIFFTGSVPTFEVVRHLGPVQSGAGCLYRVRAAGYYATIGA